MGYGGRDVIVASSRKGGVVLGLNGQKVVVVVGLNGQTVVVVGLNGQGVAAVVVTEFEPACFAYSA